MFLIGFGDADSIIANSNNAFALIELAGKTDKGIFARIFDSVINKVDDAIFQQVLIEPDNTFGTGMLVNDILVLLCKYLHFLSNSFCKFNQVKIMKSGFLFARFQFFQ